MGPRAAAAPHPSTADLCDPTPDAVKQGMWQHPACKLIKKAKSSFLACISTRINSAYFHPWEHISGFTQLLLALTLG